MSFDRRIARADAKLQREAMRPLDEAVLLAAMWDEAEPEPPVIRHHMGAKAGALHRGPGNVAISTLRHYETMAMRAAEQKCEECEGLGATEHHGTIGSCEPCGGVATVES